MGLPERSRWRRGVFSFVTRCPPCFWKGRHILWRIKIRNRRKNEKRRPSRTNRRRRQPAKRRRQRRARLPLYRRAFARTCSTQALADEGAWGQRKRYAAFVLRLLSVSKMLSVVKTYALFYIIGSFSKEESKRSFYLSRLCSA